MNRVALIVDNPLRDLPGLVLLGTRLCQEGITCFLVPVNLQSSEIWALAPDFVLLNYLRPNNEQLVRQLIEAKIQFGVLDTEGGVAESFESFEGNLIRDVTIRHQSAFICSWGPRLAQHAIGAGWYLDSQMVVTGTPRLDFYSHPWRTVALETSKYANEYDHQLILVNGNFTLANPGFLSPEAEVEMYVHTFNRDRDMVLQSQQRSRETMERFAGVCNNLAEQLPDATFVYRPHPFEAPQTYEHLLKQPGNLHLVQRGTVDGWIVRSHALIHANCSTAIEAGLAGVPALTPTWIAPGPGTAMLHDVTLQCNSEIEMIDALNTILSGNFVMPDHISERLRSIVEDWFFQIDGLAYQRVADRILKALETPSKIRMDKCRDIAYGLTYSGRSWHWRFRAVTRKTLRRSVHWSFSHWRNIVSPMPWDYSGKRFDVNEVATLVKAIQNIGAQMTPPWHEVRAASAHESDSYNFGYLQGRSVVLAPRANWSKRGG